MQKKQVTEKTKYLVFPETSFNQISLNNLQQNNTITQLQQFLTQFPNLKLVTGIGAYRLLKEGETTPNTREFRRDDGTIFRYESYNAATQLQHGQLKPPVYIKDKLVPGAEIMPYPWLFSFMKPLIFKLGGTTYGLGRQKEFTIFKGANFNESVGSIICYESLYGEYVNQHIEAGAGCLFIITNDGWWDKTAGHHQHLYFASLRAIETRRPIARAANTGISAFISPMGLIEQPTKYEEATAIKGHLTFRNHKTFYVQHGDIIARLAFLMTIGLVLVSFVRRFSPKKNLIFNL